MKLLTKEVLSKLPPLYSQDGKGRDAVAWVKFFNPTGAGSWFASEGSKVCSGHGCFDCTLCGDPANWTEFLFFGLVDLLEKELGYFALSDLEEFRGRAGLGIERDLYFKPTPIRDLFRG